MYSEGGYMNAENRIKLPSTGEAPDLKTGSIFFIGNATVLIRYAGFTILTDPTFVHMHEKVPVGYGMHATRLTNPAVDISDLPALDLVLLSHFHGDHFDQVAERELDKMLPIVTTPEAAGELGHRGFGNTHPLEKWESVTISREANLQITALPGRHGPPLSDMVMPEVMGSMLEFQSPSGMDLFRIYISGDTLVFDDLKEIPERYPHINLGLLHLGGARLLGILVTMDSEQGIEAIRIINPKLTIPIHYNDYDLFKSSLSDFRKEVMAAGLESRVRYLTHGQSFTFEIARGRFEQPWETELYNPT